MYSNGSRPRCSNSALHALGTLSIHVDLLRSCSSLSCKACGPLGIQCWRAGGLLDYDAVMEGLDNGRIGSLGLDVQWSEPWDPQDPIMSHPRSFCGHQHRVNSLAVPLPGFSHRDHPSDGVAEVKLNQ